MYKSHNQASSIWNTNESLVSQTCVSSTEQRFFIGFRPSPMTSIRRSVNSFAWKDFLNTIASTGSTIVNRFTSESDDFDMTHYSALFKLLSMSLVCQPSMLYHPLPFAYIHALGTMHDHPYPSSCPQTTLRVLASIVLQHYRLWYPGLIPLTVTRSPLYVQTVGGLFIGQLVSLTILPSTGVAGCRSSASHLFTSSTSTTIV